MGVLRSCRGRLRRTRPLNSAAENHCVCPLGSLAKTWGRGVTCCQTGKLFAGAGLCLRQSDLRTWGIPSCRRRNPRDRWCRSGKLQTAFLVFAFLLFSMNTQKRLGTPKRCAQALLSYRFSKWQKHQSCRKSAFLLTIWNKKVVGIIIPLLNSVQT